MPRNKNERKQPERNEDLPGYPHYPSDEDITKPENHTEKLDIREETFNVQDARDIPGQGAALPPLFGELADMNLSSAGEGDIVSGDSPDIGNDDDEVKIIMGTEADVTAEDLQLLGAMDENLDLGEDSDLNRKFPLDSLDSDGEPLNEGSGNDIASTGDDLDVPGSEDDDANEQIGEEDEENNYYSLGGDGNENLTEGTP